MRARARECMCTYVRACVHACVLMRVRVWVGECSAFGIIYSSGFNMVLICDENDGGEKKKT